MIESGCALVFQKDLEYWAVDEYTLEPCCALKYFPEVGLVMVHFIMIKYLIVWQVDICQSEKDGDLQAKLQAIKTAEEEDFGQSQIGQVSPDILPT